MSDGTTTTKKAKEPQSEQKTRRSKTAAAPAAIKSGPVVTVADTNAPASRFTYVLGPQEKELHEYLRCVFEPDKYAARVPNSEGGFELYTDLWRTTESGTIRAAADGTALLVAGAEGWVEAGNADGVPNAFSQSLAYTGNAPGAYWSDGGAASYATVPYGGAGVANFGGYNLDTPTDTALTPSSRLRLVAMKVSVHSVEAANTAKGEILLAGTVNPMGQARGGTLGGSTWDDIEKTNDKVITRATRSVPGWKSGEEFSIVAIPGEAQCFEMVQVPAVSACIGFHPVAHVVVMARSMSAGDKMSYKITRVWESELAKSNLAGGKDSVPPSVPLSTLMTAAGNAHKYATVNLPGIHSLPWIETLAGVNPNAVEGFSKHQSLPVSLRPSSAPSKEMVVYRPHKAEASSSSFLGKVASLGKAAIGAAANSGVLAKVPYVGPVLQGLASVLNGIFN